MIENSFNCHRVCVGDWVNTVDFCTTSWLAGIAGCMEENSAECPGMGVVLLSLAIGCAPEFGIGEEVASFEIGVRWMEDVCGIKAWDIRSCANEVFET